MISKFFLFIFGAIVVFADECPARNSDSLLINTKTGRVRGSCLRMKLSLPNAQEKLVNVYSWMSIPYAEPPVNINRFKAPKFVKKWDDILDGTRIPNSCLQIPFFDPDTKNTFLNMWSIPGDSTSKLSEDCLYLNVFSPQISNSDNLKLPVLVFFHGGHGGSVGSGINDIYDPTILATLANTIVVTVSYRLDVFGFLHLKDDDENIEGNQAILDQNLALKWVAENIECFNGNANKVTLMGSENGARLVGYHLLFKPSWPYFRNVILQSGTPVNLRKNSLSSQLASDRAKMFLTKTVGCKKGKLIDCARRMNALNLTQASRFLLRKTLSNGSFLNPLGIESFFGPVVDGKMFKESPIRAFRLGNYKKCNMLIGFNANDGASYLPFFIGSSNKTGENRQIIDFNLLVKFIKEFYFYYPTWQFENHDILLNSIMFEYTKLTIKGAENSYLLKGNYVNTLKRLLTDESFACPTLKFLDYTAKVSKVYLYRNSYRLGTSKWPNHYGVVVGDELPLVFGIPLNSEANKRLKTSINPWLSENKIYSNNDKQISLDFIQKWSNFIHLDTPNENMNNNDGMWINYQLPDGEANSNPSINDEQEDREQKSQRDDQKYFKYLAFKSDGKIANNKTIKVDGCYLWNNFIPNILEILAEIKKGKNGN